MVVVVAEGDIYLSHTSSPGYNWFHIFRHFRQSEKKVCLEIYILAWNQCIHSLKIKITQDLIVQSAFVRVPDSRSVAPQLKDFSLNEVWDAIIISTIEIKDDNIFVSGQIVFRTVEEFTIRKCHPSNFNLEMKIGIVNVLVCDSFITRLHSTYKKPFYLL